MTTKQQGLTRWIRGYAKVGDRLVEERPLRPIALPELRSIFGVRMDDPMVDSYPLTEAEALKLGDGLTSALDFRKLDYFLECDAGDAASAD